MVLGLCSLPESLFDSLTQRVYVLMNKAHNHIFCV